MRPIGFSTGALALSDFRMAIDVLKDASVDAIELSALRYAELRPLIAALRELDLSKYRCKAIHAPSSFDASQEAEIAGLLLDGVPVDWPIVLHPDAIRDVSLWVPFGNRLAIENMDRRKSIGRTVEELDLVFNNLPEARLCFDIGHARQVDTTMTEAYRILARHSGRMSWMHVSEVNTLSRHETLSYAAIWAFTEVAYLIPESVPIILEARISAVAIGAEIKKAREALPTESQRAMDVYSL